MTIVRYLAVAVLVSLLTSGGAVLLAFHLNDQQIAKQQTAQHRSAEQTRVATCLVVIAQDNISIDTPPTNDRSQKAAAAWKVLRKQLRCDGN